MSGNDELGAAAPLAIDVDGLAAALRADRGLFRRRPELLAELDVPHDAGSAASLIEYQVRVLRDRNAALQQRLDTLLRNARENEAVSRRVHRLALDLLGGRSAADMLGLVYAALQDGFRAEFCGVRIHAPPPPGELGCGEFVGAEAPGAAALDHCMASARPLCGLPDAASLTLLFGERAEQVRSCALVPLSGASLRGVLALAARDPGRFAAGAATDFLQQLGDLLSHALLRVMR